MKKIILILLLALILISGCTTTSDKQNAEFIFYVYDKDGNLLDTIVRKQTRLEPMAIYKEARWDKVIITNPDATTIKVLLTVTNTGNIPIELTYNGAIFNGTEI